MKSSAKNISLTSLDDLFSTEEERSKDVVGTVVNIPLSQLHDFPDHPFKVRDDEKMEETVESVKAYGVLVPAIVRQRPDGEYEIVSGHRRKKACELAGLTSIKAEIRELNREEAIILMVESNLQRSVILPSEKAFAYRMKMDAMRRQAGRPKKENEGHDVPYLTADVIGETEGLSGRQVKRYIVRRHIVGGANRTLFSVDLPPRLCRTGT